MQSARIFNRKFAGLSLLFFAGACGGTQTPPPPPADHGGPADDAGSALPTDWVDAGATTSATDASAPITTTSTEQAPVDACNPASANYEGLVRPKFNACYQDGKKKNPELAGEIRITLSFDYKGKITSTKVTGPDDLGKPVIACMLAAVKKTPFEFGDACASKAIMVGKKFGEQKGSDPKGTIKAD